MSNLKKFYNLSKNQYIPHMAVHTVIYLIIFCYVDLCFIDNKIDIVTLTKLKPIIVLSIFINSIIWMLISTTKSQFYK